ncbi:N-acetylmuramoyl-L-alanine amidase family protein [Paenibacillus cymbidii]|uniref:N-acetylmuramoyl-L-alanine amidase family protein n=1 Tax=Paenibacillus cymbidii TaxID=1639034 RepID=UPI0014368FAD|nr:N-acetylmuramoyl-L-alanine amidase [Paenibacillus cymbidii]
MMKTIRCWLTHAFQASAVSIAAALLALTAVAAMPAPHVAALASPDAPDNGIVICLDPGHQRYGNNELEPDGPGSAVRKPKVTSGTTGVATRKPEYVLNLEVSLLLRDKLAARGYQVVMTRDSHDVDISNKERADMAGETKADLFLRIHADGSESAAAHGISVLYPSASNAYTRAIQADSQAAAAEVLSGMIAATDAASRGTVARDDLSGFNWATVPTVLVEMGFMSNPDEDRRMSEPAYQLKLAEGMAAGIDAYFADRVPAQATEPYDGAITLTGETALFDRAGGGFHRTPYALGAQTVQAFERSGNWYHIRTWLGDLWVDGVEALAGEPEPVDRPLSLTRTTTLYSSPNGNGRPLAALAPQEVRATAAWNGWYRVDTWLGALWLQAE